MSEPRTLRKYGIGIVVIAVGLIFIIAGIAYHLYLKYVFEPIYFFGWINPDCIIYPIGIFFIVVGYAYLIWKPRHQETLKKKARREEDSRSERSRQEERGSK
ncbi:MAG: hypothetical protein ACFFEN_08010 [Candidatus Thorarchaeota archaeon]